MAESTFNEENEEISFQIIAAAGQARSLAYEALNRAKEGDFDAADDLMAQSRAAALEAHHVQTDLLTKEASGDHTTVDVLLVHAQDHLMTSMLAQELIGELIELHRKVQH
ncbi:MAG TPA: PTS lactose/cellobiose transporter subunit IIA [Candidatus Olsenella pullistercoris]|uniref:PTS lactose/cellobiose transporter subunit IIA n=1 Tax=Candidatus Olsenella pullistercoris TaxID=2838712 RepID=A0A9D2EXX5_9ACTN|nr:PTS lactose/cellobiose transporter subunit IIA [Candidatus Olsenella pullistercoris]